MRHRVFCCEIISVDSSILGVFACYVMIGCALLYIIYNKLYVAHYILYIIYIYPNTPKILLLTEIISQQNTRCLINKINAFPPAPPISMLRRRVLKSELLERLAGNRIATLRQPQH